MKIVPWILQIVLLVILFTLFISSIPLIPLREHLRRALSSKADKGPVPTPLPLSAPDNLARPRSLEDNSNPGLLSSLPSVDPKLTEENEFFQSKKEHHSFSDMDGWSQLFYLVGVFFLILLGGLVSGGLITFIGTALRLIFQFRVDNRLDGSR